jgi:hypothetical protein
MLHCQGKDAGFKHAMIVDRVVTVQSDPESVPLATQDRRAQYLAMTEDVLTWGIKGPTTSVATFSAPKAQIISIPEADRNNLVTDDITWQCNRNASTIDQEISLTFTAAT